MSGPPAAPPALRCLDPCATTLLEADFGLREPIVAVDPTDARHLVALSMGIAFDPAVALTGRYQLTLHESTDGGAAWTSEAVSPPLVGNGPSTATYDPALAFLPDGTPVPGGIALAGAMSLAGIAQAAPRAFVLREGAAVVVDAGQGAELFSPAAYGALAQRAPDKPALLAAPDGTLLMAYGVREAMTPADAPRARIALARSSDGGATWEALDAWELAASAFAGQPIALSSTRWVVPYATFESIQQDEGMTCAIARTEDAGATWTTLELGPCAFLPSLAAPGGALHAALPRARGDRVDVALIAIDEGGLREVALIERASAAGENIPTLVALDDGALLATYFHALPGGKTSYRAALVRDGVVSEPLVLDEEMTRTPRQMGEYFGLAATPEGAIATWVSDTETGGVEVVAARLAFTP